MPDNPRSYWAAIVVPSLVAGILVAAIASFWRVKAVDGGGRRPLGNRPECPHEWKGVYDTTAYEVPKRLIPLIDGQFSISQEYTKIPEYHDCQRLIVGSGPNLRYSELAAVFISAQVIREGPPATLGAPSGTTSTVTGPGGTASQTTVFVPGSRTDIQIVAPQTLIDQRGSALGTPYVEVVSEGDYAPLGIRIGFNCLYLATMTRAFMVSVGVFERDCASLTIDQSMDVTQLAVKPNVADARPGAIPTVTRWEWDPKMSVHMISVPCGPATWCDVGPMADWSTPQPHGAAGGVVQQRIKGWYDEQRLADFDGAGKAVLSDVVGTVFPVPGVADITEATYNTHVWQLVAFTSLHKASTTYSDKYGYRDMSPAGPFTAMNQISLCKGTYNECNVDRPQIQNSCQTGWFAKSQFGTNPPKYFCVHYRAYPGVNIPSVVRWRWRPNDETIWIPCPLGCCEVDADGQ